MINLLAWGGDAGSVSPFAWKVVISAIAIVILLNLYLVWSDWSKRG